MHVLITGITYSGKSNLAKRFAKMAKDSGVNVIVYDPTKSSGWPDGINKYSSPKLFLDAVKDFKNGFIFLDEAKTLFDYDTREAEKLLYKKRHDGVLTYVIAQRARMIPPNARNMCSVLFAFKQHRKDVDILTEEYGDTLLNVDRLEIGDCIYSNGFSYKFLQLDYSEGLPPLIIGNDNQGGINDSEKQDETEQENADVFEEET